MSNSAIRFSSYNRSNKVIVTSALAEAYKNEEITLQEEQDALLRRVKNENRILAKVLTLAEEYGANSEDIRYWLENFYVDEYDVETSQYYWDGYFEGQPLADRLHSSECFEALSNSDRRAVGQAMSQLCNLPNGWLRSCVYARTRGIELEAPTISWRFTREDVAA